MILNFSEVSFSDDVKTIMAEGEGLREFPLISLGVKSYVVSAVIETILSNESNHLLIGNYCSIAHNVSFLINLNHDYTLVSTYPLTKICPAWNGAAILNKGQIVIGNDVWVGRCATILDGVVIGNGAVIAANSVVTKNVPPYAIVAGNPAKIVKYRFSKEVIHKLNTIKWWYWEKEKILQNQEFFKSMSMNKVDLLYNEAPKCNISKNTNTDYSGFKSRYLFSPDFSSPYPVWKKVITEFVKRFSLKDATVLILRLPAIASYTEEIKFITQIVEEKENAPAVYFEDQGSFADEIQILSQVDYFISTRDIKSLKYIDYGCDLGVVFISGMKCPVFLD